MVCCYLRRFFEYLWVGKLQEAEIWLLLLARGIVNGTKERLALLGNHEM